LNISPFEIRTSLVAQGHSEGETKMGSQEQRAEEATIARMLRELASDMADLVAAGEMTDEEANEWVNRKADQWAFGLS
jgi:hypothetical protein